MGDCGISCAKYSMFIVNLLFGVASLGILVVGAYTFVEFQPVFSFVEGLISRVPILLMVTGGVMFVITCLGCCGAIKENSCMVCLFSIVLTALLFFQIAIGVFGFIYYDKLDGIVVESLNKTMKDYKGNERAWGILQSSFQCCGIDGPDDWKPVFQTPTELPKSCCGKIPEGKVECLNEEDNKDLYKAGCKKKVFDLINSQPIILGSLLVSLILIQIIGLGYACCLYKAFRRNYEAV